MPQEAVQTQPGEISSGWSDGEERRAPNGRIAVLVDNLWPGYLYEESQSGRGTSRTMVLFEVRVNGEALLVDVNRDCRGKSKKTLEKRIHHDREIRFFESKTTMGLRCQLFTL